ncbi:MAG TPA: SDR family NAD(P)-dependent oxidoreductase [bacterium]|nr:SDR family NAD(P)-dependent oxidoreductase [bacterium]
MSGTAVSDLSGKAIIVTGAGRGIGRAVAKELAGAGARLVLVARTEPELKRLAEELGEDRAAVVAGDVTDGATAAAAVARAAEWGGSVDGLVNNAGIGWSGPIHEMPLDAWRRLVDVNLTGVFLFTKAALPVMLRQGHGHIINIASGAGRLGMAGSAAYSASKFGLIGFTEAVGLEVRNSGVKVSAVEPGSVQTSFSAGMAARSWALRPEDVAAVVRGLLASGPNVWIREAFVTPLRVPKA